MSGTLLFNDEFNAFNAYSKSDQWHTAYHWGAQTPINGETGYYVDTENAGTTGPAGATNPFSVSNGVLSITSTPQSGLPNGQTYATGVLSSMGTFEHTYGYYEVRAEMPGGSGFWPAFWLMRSDKAWPPELDVMEYSSRLPNEYATTLHWGTDSGGNHPYAQSFNKDLGDLSKGFHTYGVDWQADKITWYFDGKSVFSTDTPSDMHSPMYLLLNQAVGSGNSWIGNPDGSTQQYKIDYVRVYDSKPTGDTSVPSGTSTSTPTTSTPTTTAPTTTAPTADKAAASITVNASGQSAGNINAHFKLLVDGKQIGDATVAKWAKDYTFSTNVTADQAHKIQVQYDNDTVVNGQDRNLIVNKITINGHAVSPTDGNVSYDRGFLDGKDVIKGQSNMWWNGTLVVNADKNIFATAKTAALAEPSASPAALDTVNVYNHLVSQTTKTGVTPVAGHDAVHMPEHADYHAMAFANDSQFDHHTDMSHLSHLAA